MKKMTSILCMLAIIISMMPCMPAFAEFQNRNMYIVSGDSSANVSKYGWSTENGMDFVEYNSNVSAIEFYGSDVSMNDKNGVSITVPSADNVDLEVYKYVKVSYKMARNYNIQISVDGDGITEHQNVYEITRQGDSASGNIDDYGWETFVIDMSEWGNTGDLNTFNLNFQNPSSNSAQIDMHGYIKYIAFFKTLSAAQSYGLANFADSFDLFNGVKDLDVVSSKDEYLNIDKDGGKSTIYYIGKTGSGASVTSRFWDGALSVYSNSVKSVGIYAKTSMDFGSTYTGSVTAFFNFPTSNAPAGGIREFTLGDYTLNTNRGAKSFAFRKTGVGELVTETLTEANEHIQDGGKIKFTITVMGKNISYAIEDVAEDGTLTNIWSGTYTDEAATPLEASADPTCSMYMQNFGYYSTWDDLKISQLNADGTGGVEEENSDDFVGKAYLADANTEVNFNHFEWEKQDNMSDVYYDSTNEAVCFETGVMSESGTYTMAFTLPEGSNIDMDDYKYAKVLYVMDSDHNAVFRFDGDTTDQSGAVGNNVAFNYSAGDDYLQEAVVDMSEWGVTGNLSQLRISIEPEAFEDNISFTGYIKGIAFFENEDDANFFNYGDYIANSLVKEFSLNGVNGVIDNFNHKIKIEMTKDVSASDLQGMQPVYTLADGAIISADTFGSYSGGCNFTVSDGVNSVIYSVIINYDISKHTTISFATEEDFTQNKSTYTMNFPGVYKGSAFDADEKAMLIALDYNAKACVGFNVPQDAHYKYVKITYKYKSAHDAKGGAGIICPSYLIADDSASFKIRDIYDDRTGTETSERQKKWFSDVINISTLSENPEKITFELMRQRNNEAMIKCEIMVKSIELFTDEELVSYDDSIKEITLNGVPGTIDNYKHQINITLVNDIYLTRLNMLLPVLTLSEGASCTLPKTFDYSQPTDITVKSLAGENVTYKLNTTGYNVFSEGQVQAVVNDLNGLTTENIEANYPAIENTIVQISSVLDGITEPQRTSFKQAILADSVNFTTDKYLEQIASEVNYAKLKNTSKTLNDFKNYAKIADITAEQSYKNFDGYLTQTQKEEILASSLLQTNSIDFLDKLYDTALVTAVKTQESPGGMEELVESNLVSIGFATPEEYEVLFNETVTKSSVYIELKADTSGIISRETIKSELLAAVAVVAQGGGTGGSGEDPGSSGGSGGGSGGSGGSGGTTSTDVPFPPVINTPEVDIKPSAGIGTNCVFSDCGGYEWAIDSINKLYKLNIISGNGNGEFSPEASVKREEFVKMLVIALGLDIVKTESSFDDVADDAWYKDYIVTAVENGLISGVGDNKFGAGNAISREDIAVIVARAFNLFSDDSDVTFEDKNNVSDYAVSAVNALSANEIIKGDDKNCFNPKNSASRAETAVILDRIIKKLL